MVHPGGSMNNLAGGGGGTVTQSNYSTGVAAPVTIYGTPVRRSTRSTTANIAANSAMVNSNKRYY